MCEKPLGALKKGADPSLDPNPIHVLGRRPLAENLG